MSKPYRYSYDGRSFSNPAPTSFDERRLCEIGGCLVYSYPGDNGVWYREHIADRTRLIELAPKLDMDDDDLAEAMAVLERLS